jgi:hypothetical protein
VGQWGHGKSRELQFFSGKGNENHQLGTEFFVHNRIVPERVRYKYVGDRMSYIHVVIRGGCCSIIVLNEHVRSARKSNDLKGSFCEKLG